MLRGLKLVLEILQARQNIISGQGATRTLNSNESGSICLFDRAAGIVYTLPSTAKIGAYFDFFVTTTITSNSAKIITSTGTELMLGNAVMNNTGTNAVSTFMANGSTHIAITQNGTTTGGIKGTWLRATCVASNTWLIEGLIQASGTVATPFATS